MSKHGSRAYVDRKRNAIVLEVLPEAGLGDVRSTILGAAKMYAQISENSNGLYDRQVKDVEREFDKKFKELKREEKKFESGIRDVDYERHINDYERMRKDLEVQKNTALENVEKNGNEVRVIVTGAYDSLARESLEVVVDKVKNEIYETVRKRDHYWFLNRRTDGNRADFWMRSISSFGVEPAVSKMRKTRYEQVNKTYNALCYLSENLEYAALAKKEG